jgi:hypothetical protein
MRVLVAALAVVRRPPDPKPHAEWLPDSLAAIILGVDAGKCGSKERGDGAIVRRQR